MPSCTCERIRLLLDQSLKFIKVKHEFKSPYEKFISVYFLSHFKLCYMMIFFCFTCNWYSQHYRSKKINKIFFSCIFTWVLNCTKLCGNTPQKSYLMWWFSCCFLVYCVLNRRMMLICFCIYNPLCKNKAIDIYLKM